MMSKPGTNRGVFGRLLMLLIAFLLSSSLLAACGGSVPAADQKATDASDASAGAASSAASGGAKAETGVTVQVGSLKGPTSIGLVDFMARTEASPATFDNSYHFSIVGTADELATRLASGDLDIALIPANLAAVLYARTEGGIQVLDVNTLGVLSVVSGDESLTSLEGLAGRTVFMTGKGTTPEYVMGYLLAQSGLSSSVQLEYKSEAAEVAASLAADPSAVGVLPEPYVTAVAAQNPALQPRVSLTKAWDELSARGAASGQLVTGVTVVRGAFGKEHPGVVAEFIAQQERSVSTVCANPATAAEQVVAVGLLEKAAVAEAAIPRCNLVCLTGEACRQALDGYLAVLYASDPGSVGGALPGQDFYYH